MKALSGRQPWWWAILHAGKRIENRRWNTSYRGPILLHASKGCTVDEFEGACDSMMDVFGRGFAAQIPELSAMPRGGIVGRARIVGCLPPDQYEAAQTGDVGGTMPHDIDLRWWAEGQFGFVLADVEPLPFVAWPGSLGLFHVPDDYATKPTPPGRIARST